MMKASIKIVSLLLLLILTGCVTLYKPNMICSPLLKEKGDLNATAAMGVSGCGLLNLQGAYAISDHAGVMLDGMYHNRRSTNADSSIENLNIFSGEAGAGYFTSIGTKKRGLFQCYGGGGIGNSSNRIINSFQNYPEVGANYFNFFIQPGVAFLNENFELAFDLKANYVQLFNIHTYLFDQFEFWNTDFRQLSDTTLNFLNFEPTVTFKIGNEKLKTVFQLGLTIPKINSDNYFEINNESMLAVPLIKFSFGLNYSFW